METKAQGAGAEKVLGPGDVRVGRVLRRIVIVASSVSMALALLALAGWVTGELLLASVRPGFIPMAPNTAAAFLLLGATLCDVRHRTKLPRVVALVIMAIAVHALLIGRGASRGQLGPFPLGVMSPVTAATFLVAGAALFSLSTQRLRPWAVPFALLTGTVGLTSVLGYVYGSPLLYQGSVIPLALTTGASFLAIGVALVARLGPRAWPTQMFVGTSVRARMQRVFVPVVVLVTLAQGWLAILIASGPLSHPALFAAALAAASVPVVVFAISRLSRRIGGVIERSEDERRHAEEQRARLEERERSASALARQKEDLTRLVVHDLKNPLSTIVMGVDLLSTRFSGDKDASDLAREVLAAADAMDRMTLDILDISRSEDGALLPRRQPVDLPALLDRIVRSMRLRLRARGTEVVISSSLAQPQISADPQLLQRVVENLLDNCMKYAPPARPIIVSVQEAGQDWVDLLVSDEGPGIPPEARAQVFEKYSRLERDAAQGVRQSRGLGLAFCRLAVEAHGGRIWVESNDPIGSRFCIRLPRTAASGSPSRTSPA
jgi:signal transduction histidine kinase